MNRFPTLAALEDLVGQPLGVSDWIEVTQARIDRFAEATDDHQWIHVDPERAAASAFGSTIAHGFLTLSLLPVMSAGAYAVDDAVMSINYGTNRVRFIHPVHVGRRLRGHFRLLAFAPIDDGAQLTVEVTMEIDGVPKPACVVEAIHRLYRTLPA